MPNTQRTQAKYGNEKKHAVGEKYVEKLHTAKYLQIYLSETAIPCLCLTVLSLAI